MNLSPLTSIETHFRSLTDPRAEHSIKHRLTDIVMITICAVICGADNWVDIENYGHAKIEWLEQFLELSQGIPSHDTLMRVFARLKPEELQQCFLNWIQAVSQISKGQIIAIDGKSLRSALERGQAKAEDAALQRQKAEVFLFGRSLDSHQTPSVASDLNCAGNPRSRGLVNDRACIRKEEGRSIYFPSALCLLPSALRAKLGQNRGAIHMVSAWACENRLVLGQQKVNAKSNEITAIPKLLELLAIEGCLVSIDAMGCQTEIARTIIEQRGDYVLALKGNHKSLYEDVVELFQLARQQDWQNIDHKFYQTINKGHGRIEIRRYWTMGQTDYLLGAEQWSGLKSIGLVESERRINNHTTGEHRYYLLSIQSDAQLFAKAVRSHWGIENQLHWGGTDGEPASPY